MSYILEALKKAEAERQLGTTPGIGSVAASAPASLPQASNARWFAFGSAILLAAAIVVWFASRPEPAPVHVAEPVKALPPKAVPAPVVAAAAPVKPVARPVPAKPMPVPSAADPDESLPLLTQLPPEVQQSVPPVSFGGYMYSSNPADRLLLIDKVLRKEGDSVAPGLILERLMPKCAVLNYRGTRYRVPY